LITMFFLIMVTPGRSIAQSCGDSHTYDATKIPEKDGWLIWQENTSGDVSYYSTGNQLVIKAYDDKSAAFYRSIPELENAHVIEFSFRAMITGAQQPTWVPVINLGMAVSNGKKIAMIWPGPNPENGDLCIGYENLYCFPGVTNWFEPHTYYYSMFWAGSHTTWFAVDGNVKN